MLLSVSCKHVVISSSTRLNKKSGHRQKSNNFQNLFKLTQNFSYIRSSLCSRHLQSFKSVLQKLFVSLALKNVLQMNSPALQAHMDPAGKLLDDPPAFLHWDRSYCCCDCCLQVRDNLGVVAIHPGLQVSP